MNFASCSSVSAQTLRIGDQLVLLVDAVGGGALARGAAAREDGGHPGHVEPLVVDLQVAQEPLDQRRLVAAVEDGKSCGEAQRRRLLAEEARPEGVEGA